MNSRKRLQRKRRIQKRLRLLNRSRFIVQDVAIISLPARYAEFARRMREAINQYFGIGAFGSDTVWPK